MCIFVKQAGRKFQGLSSTRNEATQVISKKNFTSMKKIPSGKLGAWSASEDNRSASDVR